MTLQAAVKCLPGVHAVQVRYAAVPADPAVHAVTSDSAVQDVASDSGGRRIATELTVSNLPTHTR